MTEFTIDLIINNTIKFYNTEECIVIEMYFSNIEMKVYKILSHYVLLIYSLLTRFQHNMTAPWLNEIFSFILLSHKKVINLHETKTTYI